MELQLKRPLFRTLATVLVEIAPLAKDDYHLAIPMNRADRENPRPTYEPRETSFL